VLADPEFSLTSVRDIEPPGDVLAPGQARVFSSHDGANVVLLTLASDKRPEADQGVFPTDDGSDDRNARFTILTEDQQLVLTGSGIKNAHELVKKWATTLAGSGPEKMTESLSSAGFLEGSADGIVRAGYALDYVGAKGNLSLQVFPISGGINVGATTQSSGMGFSEVVEGRTLVTPALASGDIPQLRWVEGAYLIHLIGSQSAGFADKLQKFDGSLSDLNVKATSSLADSRLLGTATVANLAVERRAGVSGSPGGVCISVREGSTACAEFVAVGSFAQISLDGTDYLIAVVPAKEPTTSYRTEPELDWASSTADGYVYSVAPVGVEESEISLFYTTRGVAPSELATVFSFKR
jgi:hypothetical protein